MSSDSYIVENLRRAYDRKAQEREKAEITPWQQKERQEFITLLLKERKNTLLEIGAGAGKDSQFFQDNGLDVVCIDLSPENIKLCRQKGLTAHVMDVMHLNFSGASFDSAYAMNCLLHVPSTELPNVLSTIRHILRPGGLFYLGQYGGVEREGVLTEDRYDPLRFFSLHSDDEIKKVTSQFFQLIRFGRLKRKISQSGRWDFRSLILRRRADEEG